MMPDLEMALGIARAEPRGARVLVVDDDSVQRAVVGRVATQAGFLVDSTPSFDEAIKLISSHNYAFITLDLSLGDRDGVEVLREISGINARTPIVVISGCDERILNSAARMAQALSLNVIETLTKPVNLTRLRAVLASRKPYVESPSLAVVTPNVTLNEVKAAIDKGEIQLAFQPKVELTTGQVIGCEALARWFNPKHGAIGPDVFIPMIESLGLMDALTESFIEYALHFCRPVIEASPDFAVAVNTSPALLYNLDFPERVERIVANAGVQPHNLTLEITERGAMTDLQRANDILLRLRIKGIGVSIDDFGTGHSSLAALARMPFSELKIDRSFVARGPDDPDMWKIACASIALAHHFGMTVVAEGVESESVVAALRKQGCDIVQGFYFAPALDIEALIIWLRDWQAGHPVSRPSMAPDAAF